MKVEKLNQQQNFLRKLFCFEFPLSRQSAQLPAKGREKLTKFGKHAKTSRTSDFNKSLKINGI